jgi:hypothetical protein
MVSRWAQRTLLARGAIPGGVADVWATDVESSARAFRHSDYEPLLLELWAVIPVNWRRYRLSRSS